MRLLVNIDTFQPLGGVERSTLQVSGELARRGHDLHLLHADRDARSGDPGLGPQWAAVAASVRRVPGFTVAARRPWRTAHQLLPAVRAAVRVGPEAIYLNRSEQLPWALASRRASRSGLVVHLRHHPFSEPLVRLLCRRPVGAPRVRFIAVSAFLRDRWVAAGLAADAVQVVPNGIDPQAYRPPSESERRAARALIGITDDRPVVLCYGRLGAEKGIATLLQAWDRLGTLTVPSATPPRLLLVGEASAAIAAAIAGRARLCVPDRPDVHHLPRRSDVLGLLHAADLVVLPALWQEPFGRVVIEAMATGVPVVASATGGIPEILTGRFADQLVRPGEPEALARAMANRLDWRRQFPGLGLAGCRHVEAGFTLARTTDAVESALLAVGPDSTARPVVVPATEGHRVAV